MSVRRCRRRPAARSPQPRCPPRRPRRPRCRRRRPRAGRLRQERERLAVPLRQGALGRGTGPRRAAGRTAGRRSRRSALQRLQRHPEQLRVRAEHGLAGRGVDADPRTQFSEGHVGLHRDPEDQVLVREQGSATAGHRRERLHGQDPRIGARAAAAISVVSGRRSPRAAPWSPRAAVPSAITRPRSSTTARSQRSATWSRAWVTRTMVRPSRWKDLMRSRHLRWNGSSPTASTSSTSRMSGSTCTATAKASRTYMPDE